MSATQLIEQVAPHSCEVSTNAKGEVTLSVKVYAADETQAATRAVAALVEARTAVRTAGLVLAGGAK